MEINKNTNVADVTLAEIHVALFETEGEFKNKVKALEYKDAIQLAKRYMELNNILLKRRNFVRRNGAQELVDPEVQSEIAREVRKIMNESGRSK